MAARRDHARGFSLIEVLVSLTLLGLAGSTLLLATAATIQSGHDALAQTIARGIAEQTTVPLKTVLFDDTDDYHQYIGSPPRDPWGIELGTGDGQGNQRPAEFQVPAGYFAGWRVEVTIAYADESDPSVDLTPPQTSGLRAVRVRVSRKWDDGYQELVVLRQLFAFVPPIGS
jgi:prepilin-type N-terminal cleavage/methylation domain-containing protein